MPLAKLGNIRIHYLDNERDAPALVFLHGFTLDHRSWRTQFDFFGTNYRVILMDSRGHGLSDAPRTGYARSDRVRDLAELLDYLSIKTAHVVGLSMGGSTGIGFALEHQNRLASLTLVSTGAAGFDAGPKIRKIDEIARSRGIDAAREVWASSANRWYSEDQKEIRELLALMMREHSGAIWDDPMRGNYPKFVDLDHVHKISVPTLIIAGEQDRIFVPLAEQLHGRIRTSSLSIYEGVGHMVNLEAPDRFNAELKEFLEGVRSSGSTG